MCICDIYLSKIIALYMRIFDIYLSKIHYTCTLYVYICIYLSKIHSMCIFDICLGKIHCICVHMVCIAFLRPCLTVEVYFVSTL